VCVVCVLFAFGPSSSSCPDFDFGHRIILSRVIAPEKLQPIREQPFASIKIKSCTLPQGAPGAHLSRTGVLGSNQGERPPREEDD
jgi:hypothetical protein